MELQEVKKWINKNVQAEEFKNVILFSIDYIFYNNPAEELNDIKKFCAYVKEKWEYSEEVCKKDDEHKHLVKSLLENALVPLSHYLNVNIEDIPFYQVYEACIVTNNLRFFINAFIYPIFNCKTDFDSYVENNNEENYFNKWIKFGSLTKDKKRIKNIIEKVNNYFIEAGEDINKWK